MRKALFLLPLFWCLLPVGSTPVKGQEEDAQLRLAASLSSDISKNFSWSTEVQQRLYDNMRRFDAFLVEPSLGYSFASHFKITGAYRLIWFDDLQDGMEIKQRISLDLRAKKDVDYWTFKFRTRLQYGFEESLLNDNNGTAKLINRNLLEVAYFIYGTRFTPYCNTDIYYYLNAPGGGFVTKYRIQLGTDIYLNKKSGLSAYFIYEPEINQKNPLTSYIYGLKYSFDL